MALSLGNPQGWTFSDVAQPQALAPAGAPASHLEAREGPGPAQWQAVKEEIRILYEKHPLKDVRKILEQRWGFRATERMYKARLSHWGFSKNSCDRDYQICAVLHHIRQKGGKHATAFLIHGHKRSLKDLHKYIKSRKMSEEQFLATALKNVRCRSQEEQEQEPQYAHVRAYSSEPEGETEAPATVSAPIRGAPGEIAANPAKYSPPYAEPVSASGSCSTSVHPDPITPQRLSSHEIQSPVYWSALGTQLTPPTRQRAAAQSPTSNGNGFLTWHQDSTSRSSSSSPETSSSAIQSHGLSSTDPSLVALEDRHRYAGSPHIADKAVMPCQRLGKDVEFMALQMTDAPSLKSLCGHEDIHSWRLMCDTSSPDSDDFEWTCPSCNEYTKDHLISLPNLELPQGSRSILNETSDIPDNTIQVPGSLRGHEHSWRWVVRCFSACIYINRGDEYLSQISLADADAEFEQMLIPPQEPKIILALNQTLQILHMHNQGGITKRIMESAYNVARRVLGPDDPLTVITKWMVLVADLEVKKGIIPSPVLHKAHLEFVRRHGPKDPRSIGSLYCYGFMLNLEPDLEKAERVLREVYDLSCAVLSPQHLQSIAALTNLHRCMVKQGEIEKGIEMLERAIRDSRESLGPNHPRRLESMRLLALLYEKQNKTHLTEELYWVVLEGKIRMLGKNHTFTQGVKCDLEILLKKLGKWGTDRSGDADDENLIEGNITGKGKGRASVSVDDFETPEQLRLRDLFNWDPNEKYGSRQRKLLPLEVNPTRQTQDQVDVSLDLISRSPDNISFDWDLMDADIKSLGDSDDSGSLQAAF